jgi:Ca-activated chloride channel family protein
LAAAATSRPSARRSTAGGSRCPRTIEPTGFFAEHHTTLPAPTCGDRLCLHAMLSVAPDLVKGGWKTLIQLGVNTPLDPDSFPRPPLDLVVVVDRSGSMAGRGQDHLRPRRREAPGRRGSGPPTRSR